MVSWKLGLELDLEGCVGVQRERERDFGCGNEDTEAELVWYSEERRKHVGRVFTTQ